MSQLNEGFIVRAVYMMLCQLSETRKRRQITGTTAETSVQKSAVLGTVKIPRRTLNLPGLWSMTRA